MKNFFVIICTISVLFLYSQVGINQTNPKALLDVNVASPNTPSITDGILIARVNTLNYTPSAEQNSMLVYLNNQESYTAGTQTCTRTPGYYFWDNDNTSWFPVGTKVSAQDSGLILYQNDCKYYELADAVSGTLAQTDLYTWTTNNQWQKIIVANEVIDNYNSYNTSDGILTCRESGTYRLSITLDLTATLVDSNATLIFGMVKLATGNNGTETPSSTGNTYVTRNSAVFSTSTPAYAEPVTIVTFVDLEQGERYALGALSFNMASGESIVLNAINSGGTGWGYSTSVSLDRVR